jgi:hypothetical protein
VSLFDPFQELLIIFLLEPVALLGALTEPAQRMSSAICLISFIMSDSCSDMGRLYELRLGRHGTIRAVVGWHCVERAKN